jgi:hypothetical protein
MKKIIRIRRRNLNQKNLNKDTKKIILTSVQKLLDKKYIFS